MADPNDSSLLREYAERQSESAFSDLVQRHVNFVYSVAMRYVANPPDAQDVVQAVFVILAQKSADLCRRTTLTGWLYEATRLTARQLLRAKARRLAREREAYMQSTLNPSGGEQLWHQLAPHLEEAMSRLRAADRELLALRFYENKTGAEAAALLGIGAAAAHKRTNRALEKLQRLFAQRGVDSTTAAIAKTISANSVQTAPVALAKTVTLVALAKGAAAPISTLTLIKGALKVMAWTKAKTAIAAGAIVLLVAGTTTVTMKEVRGRSIDNSWRVLPLNGRRLDQVPPQVRIVPSKIYSDGGWIRNNRMQVMGVGVSLADVVEVAYGFWSPARTIISTKLPETKYDFIANLPVANAETLQQQIKKKFGVIGRIERRETRVLLLKVKHPDAQGLKRSINRHESRRYGTGEYVFTGQPLANFAGTLEYRLKIPVIDQTGLTGPYDFQLKWNQSDDQSLNLKNLKQALLDQLGLELVPTNMSVKMLVVEKGKLTAS